MSTTIEWTQRPGTKGETWNPVVGCTKVSAGCKNCYAKRIHDNRHKAYQEGKMQRTPQYASPFEAVQLMHQRVALPLSWKKPRTIFVNSVSDLFHPDVPFDFIDRVFAIMALTPQHTYQILTKRPERMAMFFSTRDEFAAMMPEKVKPFDSEFVTNESKPIHRFRHPLPNVWLGTSVENQATANERIPHLLRVPAAVRFLSCEPLLGPVEITPWALPPATLPQRIHWVITGGESGPGARPMHPAWARSLRDQCAAAGVPFFFKQWGRWAPWVTDHLTSLKDTKRFPGDYLDHYDARVRIVQPDGKRREDAMYIPGDALMCEWPNHDADPELDGQTHTHFPLSTHHSKPITP